jgi:pSer/pThr/pTyr-binding forkhead associated (FHA) protein
MRQLTHLRNGQKQGEYLLDLGDVIVGRGRNAHIKLDDNPVVSRQHAVIREKDGQHTVEDLGGPNGTFVGDRKIDHHVLRPGERIVLGIDALRYDFGNRSATSLRALAGQTDSIADADADVLPLDAVDAISEHDSLVGLRAQGGEAAGGERTTVASKDDLERLLQEMKVKARPHIELDQGGKPELIPLGDRPATIGFGEGCQVRLPGSRWLPGKIAGQFVSEGGVWCVVPASTFWLPIRFKGSTLKKLRRLADGDTLQIAGTALRYRKGEAR